MKVLQINAVYKTSSTGRTCYELENEMSKYASLPGGFCPQAKARPSYLAARGLPGTYAPEQAAAIIRRAVLRHLSLEETV